MIRDIPAPESIDDYISSFPRNIQTKLLEIRKAIHAVTPQVEEKISYQIPSFYLNGILVHFAAYSNHIGFYPTPGGIEAFRKELSKYKYAKGSVQFPIDEPLPIELIKQIVAYRVEENNRRGKKK